MIVLLTLFIVIIPASNGKCRRFDRSNTQRCCNVKIMQQDRYWYPTENHLIYANENPTTWRLCRVGRGQFTLSKFISNVEYYAYGHVKRTSDQIILVKNYQSNNCLFGKDPRIFRKKNIGRNTELVQFGLFHPATKLYVSLKRDGNFSLASKELAIPVHIEK